MHPVFIKYVNKVKNNINKNKEKNLFMNKKYAAWKYVCFFDLTNSNRGIKNIA